MGCFVVKRLHEAYLFKDEFFDEQKTGDICQRKQGLPWLATAI